jgi:hypothetical protein
MMRVCGWHGRGAKPTLWICVSKPEAILV